MIKSHNLYEPPLDKTNEMTCVLSEDSDQPGLRPTLIRVFAVRMKKHWALRLPFERTVKTLIRLGDGSNLSMITAGFRVSKFFQIFTV